MLQFIFSLILLRLNTFLFILSQVNRVIFKQAIHLPTKISGAIVCKKSTTIRFQVAVESDVTLKMFNVLGQEVANVLNSKIEAGFHEVLFDASGLNSGVYFYQLQARGVDGKDYNSTKKMLLTK